MVHQGTGRTTMAVAACLLSGLLCGCTAADADVEPLAMYPVDGSSAAGPATGISFRGPGWTSLADLRVSGSVTGTVSGELVPHEDEGGVSFQPDDELVPGEEIVVATAAELAGVGERSFRIAVPGTPPAEQPARSPQDLPPPTLRELLTMPDAAVPQITVEGDVGDGLFLSTPLEHLDGQAGAQITDAEGELVWWQPPPAAGVAIGALEMHELDGEPVLAWFEGTAPYGVGNFQGEWVVVDSSYREVARLPGANGIASDLHDLVITERGTALIVAYQPIVMNLRAVGGPSEALVMDAVVQEVDIGSGDLLFEWHSVDHVPITDSVVADTVTQDIVDYAHINAADIDVDGRILVSLRHTSQVMEIDRVTGEPVWALGGPSGTVVVEDDRGISYPHHVRWLPRGRVSVFDNGVGQDPETSRGVVYQLDGDHETAQVVQSYVAAPPDYTETQGSLQTGLDDGGALAMWSVPGRATRFDASGRPTGSIDLGTGSYRMFEADWVGTPETDPTVVPNADGLVISWNGATEVAAWELLADGQTVETVAVTGFETTLPLPSTGDADWLVVRALDADGQVLDGSSVTTQVP